MACSTARRPVATRAPRSSRWLGRISPRLEKPLPAGDVPACGDRVWIVVNPRAGARQHIEGDVAAAVAYLRRSVPQVEVRWTTARGEATLVALEAVQAGATAVVAAGGDGTMNEVAQALVGTKVALGVLPVGTVNVWAREMGIGLAPVRAAHSLLTGERHTIDVGRVNGRVFLLMVGIGLDGEATHVIEQRDLGGLRKLVRYVPLVIGLALRARGSRVKVRLDARQEIVRPLMIVVSNTRLYGGAFAFNPGARADDGQLDICVIEDQSLGMRAVVFLRALLRRPVASGRVRYDRFSRATIASPRRLRVQVDGEMFGSLPVTIEIVPHALDVIVPRRLPHAASLGPARDAAEHSR
jgi:diacylglycerol kinase (ATP)